MQMTAKSYERLFRFFRQSPLRQTILLLAAKYLPVILAATYGIGAIWLCKERSVYLLRYLLVPAAVFLGVSILRSAINRPRPYDQLGYEPLAPAKRGKGKSFPSRHTASAFIIALALLTLSPVVGIAALTVACLIGASRVLTGVHYPSDVLTAVVFPVVLGIFGFWIL